MLPAEWIEALKQAAGRYLPLLADFSPPLGCRFGLSEGAREEEPAHHLLALSHFLVQAASLQPLLVVLEDLHWADPSSLRVLRAVEELWPKTNSLLLLSGRSDSLPKLEHTHLVLENLSEAELQQLLEEALGDCSDPRLLQQIQLASSGNPLAALTLLEAALDGGACKGMAWKCLGMPSTPW